MGKPYAKAYTFASNTSLDTIQSLQKSMLFPTPRKNKKHPLLKKNKTLPTHSQSNEKGMTEQTENIRGMSLEKKEGQLVTHGIVHAGFRGFRRFVARKKVAVN